MPLARPRDEQTRASRRAPGIRVSPHEPSINDALIVLDFAGTAPREVVLVGIVPSTLDGGIVLSAAVEGAVGRAAGVVELARRAAQVEQLLGCHSNICRLQIADSAKYVLDEEASEPPRACESVDSCHTNPIFRHTARGMTLLNLRPIHPFPARMAPAIAFDALPELGRPLRVLDPMAGSGTTLVAARLRGHEPFGFDTDPLAVLISKAWCAEFNPVDFKQIAEDVLSYARFTYRSLKLGDAYPAVADDETRAFVRYWFDATSRRQLAALATSIEAQTSATYRGLLWVAFSRLIITKAYGASLAMDVSHSRPHRVYDRAPALPFENFMAQIQRIAAANPFAGKNGPKKPRARIRLGDARQLTLDDASIDLVITSPPYLNAIDYLRGHKLSLVWMGHTIDKLRGIRTANIGTEVSTLASLHERSIDEIAARMGTVDALSARHRGMLARYISDLDATMRELARVLRSSGRAVFVVGNSTLRGTFIRNSEAVKHLANRYGFSLERSRKRPLPDHRRYLPPPSAASDNTLHARMREEVIVELRR